MGVLGGARLTNEDAYAWAKLAKGVLGTDNVDEGGLEVTRHFVDHGQVFNPEEYRNEEGVRGERQPGTVQTRPLGVSTGGVL